MQHEFEFTHSEDRVIAGVDEVGRGPLAGLNDSKKLSERQRLDYFAQIQDKALGISIARASVAEIDECNILRASLLAMERAARGLPIQPEFVYVDGNQLPKWRYPSEAIVKGDERVAEIAAASIVAKVTRDAEMVALEQDFPGYGFAKHKGYPTSAHLKALEILGPCVLHRRTFAPVANLLK